MALRIGSTVELSPFFMRVQISVSSSVSDICDAHSRCSAFKSQHVCQGVGPIKRWWLKMYFIWWSTAINVIKVLRELFQYCTPLMWIRRPLLLQQNDQVTSLTLLRPCSRVTHWWDSSGLVLRLKEHMKVRGSNALKECCRCHTWPGRSC